MLELYTKFPGCSGMAGIYLCCVHSSCSRGGDDAILSIVAAKCPIVCGAYLSEFNNNNNSSNNNYPFLGESLHSTHAFNPLLIPQLFPMLIGLQAKLRFLVPSLSHKNSHCSNQVCYLVLICLSYTPFSCWAFKVNVPCN